MTVHPPASKLSVFCIFFLSSFFFSISIKKRWSMFSYTGVNSVVCLALRTIFITDVVVPGDGCKTENPLLFKIVPKFISKHKPLMLWHKLNSKRVPGALSLVCPMAGFRSNSTKYYMPYVMQYFGTGDELRVVSTLSTECPWFFWFISQL